MPDPIITASPDTLTLAPGDSAQVNIAVDPASVYGIGGVTIPVTVPSPYDHIWEGEQAVVVPPGEHHLIRGVLDQTAGIHIRGLLTVDAFATINGHNQHDIHTHAGGVMHALGKQKTAWCRWGDPVIGWEVGDRLAIAPMAMGNYVPVEALWTGDWNTLVRPLGSPNVSLLDGRIARPEVVNLSQTLTIQNVTRIMFHESEGIENIQILKWLRVLNSGVAGKLGFYAIHFHLLGESARGSIVEEVVVEGPKFRSFVPHGSHGITIRGSVAYNSEKEALWWDEPSARGNTDHESNDTLTDRLFALSSTQSGTAIGLPPGLNNRCIDSAAAGGNKLGLFWMHQGRNVWELERFIAHNLTSDQGSIRAWQNDGELHQSNDLTIFNSVYGLLHGAYNNQFQWGRLLIQGVMLKGESAAVQRNALNKSTGPVKYTDILTDGRLLVAPHKGSPGGWSEFIRCTFTEVRYSETISLGDAGSWFRFIDCGLTPSDFIFTKVHPTTKIEIIEVGELQHSWAEGEWSD